MKRKRLSPGFVTPHRQSAKGEGLGAAVRAGVAEEAQALLVQGVRGLAQANVADAELAGTVCWAMRRLSEDEKVQGLWASAIRGDATWELLLLELLFLLGRSSRVAI